jgi:hypothetical protein
VRPISSYHDDHDSKTARKYVIIAGTQFEAQSLIKAGTKSASAINTTRIAKIVRNLSSQMLVAAEVMERRKAKAGEGSVTKS